MGLLKARAKRACRQLHQGSAAALPIPPPEPRLLRSAFPLPTSTAACRPGARSRPRAPTAQIMVLARPSSRPSGAPAPVPRLEVIPVHPPDCRFGRRPPEVVPRKHCSAGFAPRPPRRTPVSTRTRARTTPPTLSGFLHLPALADRPAGQRHFLRPAWRIPSESRARSPPSPSTPSSGPRRSGPGGVGRSWGRLRKGPGGRAGKEGGAGKGRSRRC